MSRSVTPQEQKRDLIILGAAGPWLLSLAEYAEDDGWRVRAVVNNLSAEEVEVLDCPYPLYQLRELPEELREIPAFCCLVTPAYRRAAIGQATGIGMRNFARLIRRSAAVARSATLGEGTYVGTMTIVGPRAQVGRHVHLVGAGSVGHGARIADFVTVAGGVHLGSMCSVQEGAYVGIRAAVVPRITIGRNAVVAAGAVVTQDVPDHCLVAGVPAVAKKTGIPGYRGD